MVIIKRSQSKTEWWEGPQKPITSPGNVKFFRWIHITLLFQRNKCRTKKDWARNSSSETVHVRLLSLVTLVAKASLIPLALKRVQPHVSSLFVERVSCTVTCVHLIKILAVRCVGTRLLTHIFTETTTNLVLNRYFRYIPMHGL